MTTITFFTEGSRIIGFDAAGHSGYAEAGADIVCAAVTSAVRVTECTLNDVMGLSASVHTDGKKARIALRLPGGLSVATENAAQALLTGLMVYLSQLQEEYPDHIEVMEA